MYTVQIVRRAQKDLRALDAQTRTRILGALEGLARDPRPAAAKPLRGAPPGQDLWRLRVGDWRIVYKIDGGHLVVLILRIRHRREAYR